MKGTYSCPFWSNIAPVISFIETIWELGIPLDLLYWCLLKVRSCGRKGWRRGEWKEVYKGTGKYEMIARKTNSHHYSIRRTHLKPVTTVSTAKAGVEWWGSVLREYWVVSCSNTTSTPVSPTRGPHIPWEGGGGREREKGNIKHDITVTIISLCSGACGKSFNMKVCVLFRKNKDCIMSFIGGSTVL